MKLFDRVHKGDSHWRQDAETLLSSVSRFLMDVNAKRGKTRISKDEYILERKLIFLLDDLRRGLRKNVPVDYHALAAEINECWYELYKIS